MKTDHTHHPAVTSWVPGADQHEQFPVQNLPFGVFSSCSDAKRIGCAIGDWVLDLSALAQKGVLPTELVEALGTDTLNDLFAMPASARRGLRKSLFACLTQAGSSAWLRADLHPAAGCEMHMPFRVGDYTDFYVGIHHATNIGKLFRPDEPLLPNYKHVPIGYHGRASSVRPSGTRLTRPMGQTKMPDQPAPQFGPTARLDYELELGVWIAGDSALGHPVPIADAWDRIGGFCLLNDWSARDIQAWEYQPLGPFLSKNFLTTVSPWVVTAEALAPFRIPQRARPAGDPQPLPYLANEADGDCGALSVRLEVKIASQVMRKQGMAPLLLSTGPASNMYWTVAQMIAHHTSNGCDLRAGDLLGTGTISGDTRETFGSLMEISGGGRDPVQLPSGEKRCFLEDGDEVSISAVAEREGYRSIGFGSCSGTVASVQQ